MAHTAYFRASANLDSYVLETYHEAYLQKKVIHMLQTAKVFAAGRSQAVRLPLEFRFDVPEVFIRRDAETGDVVLSKKPSDWQGLLEAVALNANEDLLIERRLPSTSPNQSRRDPFEGWQE